MECLAESERGNTYLLSEKEGDKKYVLKCYPKAEMTGENKEGALLSVLNHKGIPKFETEIDDGETLFVLREYAEGMTLDQYLEEQEGITVAHVINIAVELCGILSYLYSQSPPIVHRDIKPSNIVINTDGYTLKLIDFGISRRYSEDVTNDTQYFGTKEFSAPEQYGFAQTDNRTDLYALGVVMRYMLTGTTTGQVQDRNLAAIVGKCTAFDPEKRYQSADALKRVLINYRNRARRVVLLIVAAVIVLPVAGFLFVNLYTNYTESRRMEALIPTVNNVHVLEGYFDGYEDEINGGTDNHDSLTRFTGGASDTDSLDKYYLGEQAGAWDAAVYKGEPGLAASNDVAAILAKSDNPPKYLAESAIDNEVFNHSIEGCLDGFEDEINGNNNNYEMEKRYTGGAGRGDQQSIDEHLSYTMGIASGHQLSAILAGDTDTTGSVPFLGRTVDYLSVFDMDKALSLAVSRGYTPRDEESALFHDLLMSRYLTIEEKALMLSVEINSPSTAALSSAVTRQDYAMIYNFLAYHAGRQKEDALVSENPDSEFITMGQNGLLAEQEMPFYDYYTEVMLKPAREYTDKDNMLRDVCVELVRCVYDATFRMEYGKQPGDTPPNIDLPLEYIDPEDVSADPGDNANGADE
jgi:hypothetical protein